MADESGTAGPRWTRTFFTPETTRDHTLTLAWTGGGNLSMAVRIVATNQWVYYANTSNNPEVITTELTAGVEYKIAVWAVSGVGTYTLTVDDEPTSGLELLSGVADESGTAGPRWTRTFFTPETTRDHTLTLAWTGGGNLSMAVRIAATNQWVDDAYTSNNPEVITTELTAGVEYKIAVWAVSGVGTYTLSVDGPQPSGGLTIQRNHLDAAAGPAEISAAFTPTTSGPVTIELSWTGAADLDLIVERANRQWRSCRRVDGIGQPGASGCRRHPRRGVPNPVNSRERRNRLRREPGRRSCARHSAGRRSEHPDHQR